MKASQRIIKVMHHFESCRLEAYPDPGSKDGHPWTIGWGATGPDIKKGTRWTYEQAEQRFGLDIVRFEKGVEKLLFVLGSGNIRPLPADQPIPQHHFDAFVSFSYNVGLDIDEDKIAEGLGDSTLLRLYLAGEHRLCAEQFLKWKNNDGKTMWGLMKRRAAERDIFLHDSTAEAAIAVGEMVPRPERRINKR